MRARLDTICAIRKDIIKDYNYAVFEVKENFMVITAGVPGNTYLINVLAQIKEPNGESEIVPYRPVEV